MFLMFGAASLPAECGTNVVPLWRHTWTEEFEESGRAYARFCRAPLGAVGMFAAFGLRVFGLGLGIVAARVPEIRSFVVPMFDIDTHKKVQMALFGTGRNS